MKKKIAATVLLVLVLVGVLAGIKLVQIRKMVKAGEQSGPPPETVTVAPVQIDTWESFLSAVGSLEAVQGVTIAAEVAGKVTEISFDAGTWATRGDLLLRQDLSTEQARLPGAESAVATTRSNLERARRLLAEKVISEAEYDSALTNFRLAQAELEAIRASMAKKTVRAPFTGRLGIRLVNLGQVLQEGDPIVSLQSLNPIFVNFPLPQQALAAIRPGLPVRVTSDALQGEFRGKITAVNPQVDVATRNLWVQGTLENPEERLHPGMFVSVSAVLPDRLQVLVIPATAVLHAPYGNSVFVVEGQDADQKKVLRQQFVRLGEKRGDFIAVTEGLNSGEMVVTTGVFKLRNGQAVVVDNSLAPDFELQPAPGNE